MLFSLDKLHGDYWKALTVFFVSVFFLYFSFTVIVNFDINEFTFYNFPGENEHMNVNWLKMIDINALNG